MSDLCAMVRLGSGKYNSGQSTVLISGSLRSLKLLWTEIEGWVLCASSHDLENRNGINK